MSTADAITPGQGALTVPHSVLRRAQRYHHRHCRCKPQCPHGDLNTRRPAPKRYGPALCEQNALLAHNLRFAGFPHDEHVLKPALLGELHPSHSSTAPIFFFSSSPSALASRFFLTGGGLFFGATFTGAALLLAGAAAAGFGLPACFGGGGASSESESCAGGGGAGACSPQHR